MALPAGQVAQRPHPHATPTEEQIVADAATKWHVNSRTLWGVYGVESGFGSNLGPSSAGAVGPFQFLPSTAHSLGVNPHDFRSAAFGAAKYLHQLGADGRPDSTQTTNALNRYNGNRSGSSPSTYSKGVLEKGAKFNTAPGDQGPGAVSNAVAKVTDPVVKAADAVPNFLAGVSSAVFSADFWRRVGLSFLGVVALILGAYFIGSQFMSKSGVKVPPIPL